MLSKDLLTERIALAERNGGEACPLGGEVNTANAGEQGKVR